MGAAKPVTDSNFDAEVLKADVPALVDFYADWCTPCVRMAPIIEDVAGEYEGKVKVCKLDVSANNKVATKYSIMSIPTLIIFKNGEIVEESVGALSKDQVKAKLDAVLGSADSAG